MADEAHAMQAESSEYEYRPLTLTLNVLAWEVPVVDQVEDGRSDLSGSGELTFRDDWEVREILIAEDLPITDVRCEISFCQRTTRASEIEPIKGLEEDRLSVFSEPAKPLGNLSFFSGGDDLESMIVVHVALAPDNFDELRRRHLDGRTMPTRLHLRLPRVSGVRVRGARSSEAFLLANCCHLVTSVAWIYGDHEPESRWPMSNHRNLLLLIDRFIDAISWEDDGWKLGFSQFNLVAGELLASALDKVRRREIVSNETEDWLRHAWSIASDTWDALLRAEQSTQKQKREIKTKSRFDDGQPVTLPWRKRQPMVDVLRGVESRLWSGIARDELETIVERYLTSDLDSPSFEWICADMLVYAEVGDFGESIKQRAPRSLRNPLGINDRYFLDAGNLERMQLTNLKISLGWLSAKFAFWIGLPVAGGMYFWSQGEQDAVIVGAVGWIVVMLVWLFVRKLLGIGRGAKSFLKEVERQSELLAKMVAAYGCIDLGRPPGSVRRALETISEEGAVWNGRVMSLLMKAELRDRITWGKNSYEMWTPPLSRTISDRLKSAYNKHREAGTQMQEPDYDKDPYSL